MIGMLLGTVALKNPPYIILDVNGVGYKVSVTTYLLSKAIMSEALTLFTYTHVRDDALELYGFTSAEDLRLFELLISVSGVGCKSALGVLSIGSRSEVVNAVITGNVGFFMAVPRLGKKNGQKIIIELKNKLGGGDDLNLTEGESSEMLEAIAALQTVGFSPHEAEVAIHKVSKDGMETEELVRLALKALGK